jgi:hypothetical protein
MTMQLPTGRKELTKLHATATLFAAGLFVATFTGCTSLTQPIEGIPANRLPPEFFPEPKNDLVPVDVSLLSIEPPRDYELAAGDILGVYIEGVLPFNSPEQPPEPPPVNFPAEQSTLPPSIGFPIPVQDDGTLSLPLIEPLDVDGLTLDQVREAIRDAYIDQDILRPEKARPIVTIIKERTYDVVVIRQDTANFGPNGQGLLQQSLESQFLTGSNNRSATGGLVRLPAYKNDILHALVETGGLPGVSAKNEVQVLRSTRADQRKRAQFLQQWYAEQERARMDPCYCPPDLPDDPSILRIPLRVKPGVIPDITEEQVRLNTGDIVFVETRETEVFYTGGLLRGAQIPIPRDFDLDALGAMALAGGAIGGSSRQFGLQVSGGIDGVPPGMLYILRQTPCNGQVAIEVDIARALNDPRSRPLIQPGDTLILQYKPEEQLINFGLSTFFTFGVAEIFRQSRN